MKNLKYKNQSGQALLIIVLVLAVALVVVLSISTRTVTDITQTSYDENALRAFSAAEAGVEDALLKNVGTSGSAVTVDSTANVSYTTDFSTPVGTQTFNHPEPALSGQSRTFWLVSHNPTSGALTCSGSPCVKPSQIEVCWGTGSPTPIPAVEVSLYYDPTFQAVASTNNYAGVKTARFTSDPSGSRRSSNNFSADGGPCAFSTGTFTYSTGVINISSLMPPTCTSSFGCQIMAKVRILYNTTVAQPIGFRIINGSGDLPSQGIQISSTGTAGDSTRKVSVFRSFAEPQSVFDAGVFSYNDLSK